MIFRKLALAGACAFGVLGAAGVAWAQDLTSTHELARRTTEMAADANIDVTVADAFTPGPAEPPAVAQSLAPAAPRPGFRNPWTTPRPTMRQAFSEMVAAFKADFQDTVPPPRSVAAADGPEPSLDPAGDIDFTVADAFDARRLGAPSATSQAAPASAQVGERDDGVARARALNLEAAERNKSAASAIEAHEAAQREYEKALTRWREQLEQ